MTIPVQKKFHVNGAKAQYFKKHFGITQGMDQEARNRSDLMRINCLTDDYVQNHNSFDVMLDDLSDYEIKQYSKKVLNSS